MCYRVFVLKETKKSFRSGPYVVHFRPFIVIAPCHAVGMDAKAAVQTVKGIGSSVAVLAVFVHEAAGAVAGSVSVTGSGGLTVADPLRDEADAWLDVLAGTARLEARVAALKVQAAAGFAAAAAALAAPDASVSERDALEMSVTAEVACALTVSEGAAARFLEESARLSTDLPLTLAALGAGTLSWQHGRIMCDETEGLSPEAAAALEAHFLDPDAPNPARGCAAGELTPARFRAKARYWRERHHPVSIEKRHHKCVTDRRLEYAPDRTGTAWRGCRPICRRIRRPGSGTAPPPPPAPCRGQPSPEP